MKTIATAVDPRLAQDRAGRADFPHLFGAHDLSRLDTTPGAVSPFAPRAGWTPSLEEYVEAMRVYCRVPCGPRQLLTALARRTVMQNGAMPETVGPYATQLAGILSAFVTAHHRALQQQAEAPAANKESWRPRRSKDRSTPGLAPHSLGAA